VSISQALSQGIGPLAVFDEHALKELAPHGAARSFPKNTIIINEGDETDSLYVLLSGRVKVFVSDEDGKEVVLSTAREGNYFGEMVLDGGKRSASVMTLEPTRCFVIPMSDIEGLLERNPLFARHLIHLLIAKTRSLVKQVRDLALKDVYGRFAKFVDESAVEQDGARVVPERLTQQDIAERIGGHRTEADPALLFALAVADEGARARFGSGSLRRRRAQALPRHRRNRE